VLNTRFRRVGGAHAYQRDFGTSSGHPRRASPLNDTRPVATDGGSSVNKPFRAAEAAEEGFKPGSMNNINESVVTLFPNLRYTCPNIGKLTL